MVKHVCLIELYYNLYFHNLFCLKVKKWLFVTPKKGRKKPPSDKKATLNICFKIASFKFEYTGNTKQTLLTSFRKYKHE